MEKITEEPHLNHSASERIDDCRMGELQQQMIRYSDIYPGLKLSLTNT